MNSLKLVIEETGRGNLKDTPRLFNQIVLKFGGKEAVKEYLKDRYGKLPAMRNKIYIDTKEGAKEIGFLHSFWNQDISHNSKKWFQTDWITVYEVNEIPVLL